MMNRKQVVRIVSAFAAILLAMGAYSGWNALQSWRGEQALAATGLPFVTLKDALSAARLQGRPVLVDFSAIWCPTCRALHRDVFTDAGVKHAIAAGYVLARVDFDAPEAPAFMQRYGVQGFPSLLVLDPDGRLLRRLPVTLEPASFVAELQPPA